MRSLRTTRGSLVYTCRLPASGLHSLPRTTFPFTCLQRWHCLPCACLRAARRRPRCTLHCKGRPLGGSANASCFGVYNSHKPHKKIKKTCKSIKACDSARFASLRDVLLVAQIMRPASVFTIFTFKRQIHRN